MNLEFQTDQGNFPEILTHFSLKEQIIIYGSSKTPNEFVLCSNSMYTDDNSNPQRFSSDLFYVSTEMNSKRPQIWLCYSVVLPKTYCETC